MWIVYYIEIEIISFVINLGGDNAISYGKIKSKNGAEILDSFVLLRYNSLGYMKENKVSKNGMSMFKKFNFKFETYYSSIIIKNNLKYL